MIFKLITLLAAIFVLGFAFYWFQLRVSAITVKCAKFADDVKFGELAKSTQTQEELKRIDQVSSFQYTMCLHRNGL